MTRVRLGNDKTVAFIPTIDAAKAMAFYRDVLGLTLAREEMPFAVIFEVNGSALRLSVVGELQPASWTIFGWEVPNVLATVRALESSGVQFERFAEMNQNDDRIWNSPTGAQVAWFKDPDGNVLSVSGYGEEGL